MYSIKYHINDKLNYFIWRRVIERAVNVTKKLVINTQEEFMNLYKLTVDDLKKLYPEEYKYVTEQEAFTFEDIQDALKDGINIHAYACRTNQEHRYVFLDEEDYTEDSKYYKRWENHKSEIEDKDTPNIYPKFSYII